MNEAGNSKADTLVKLVLIFFISLLSFSVGTFVGKQFSDTQHRLAELDDDSETLASEEQYDVPEDERVSEDDVAQLAEEFIRAGEKENTESKARTAATLKLQPSQKAQSIAADQTRSPAQENLAEPEKKRKKSMKEQMKKVQKAAAAIAHKKSPVDYTEKKPKRRVPSSLPSSVASDTIGKYTVQVSSHRDESEAKRNAMKLKEKGFGAFYVPAQVKGSTWYRVSVGVFTTRENALDYRKKLMRQAKLKSAFVQKIVK